MKLTHPFILKPLPPQTKCWLASNLQNLKNIQQEDFKLLLQKLQPGTDGLNTFNTLDSKIQTSKDFQNHNGSEL